MEIWKLMGFPSKEAYEAWLKHAQDSTKAAPSQAADFGAPGGSNDTSQPTQQPSQPLNTPETDPTHYARAYGMVDGLPDDARQQLLEAYQNDLKSGMSTDQAINRLSDLITAEKKSGVTQYVDPNAQGTLRGQLEQQRQGTSAYGETAGAVANYAKNNPIDAFQLATLPFAFGAGAVDEAGTVAAPALFNLGSTGAAVESAASKIPLINDVPLLNTLPKLAGTFASGTQGAVGAAGEILGGNAQRAGAPEEVTRVAANAPAFAAGPGSLLEKGVGLGLMGAGGEISHQLGGSRTLGEWTAPLAGGVTEGGIASLAAKAGIVPRGEQLIRQIVTATDDRELIDQIRNMSLTDKMQLSLTLGKKNPALARELSRAISAAEAGDLKEAGRLRSWAYDISSRFDALKKGQGNVNNIVPDNGESQPLENPPSEQTPTEKYIAPESSPDATPQAIEAQVGPTKPKKITLGQDALKNARKKKALPLGVAQAIAGKSAGWGDLTSNVETPSGTIDIKAAQERLAARQAQLEAEAKAHEASTEPTSTTKKTGGSTNLGHFATEADLAAANGIKSFNVVPEDQAPQPGKSANGGKILTPEEKQAQLQLGLEQPSGLGPNDIPAGTADTNLNLEGQATTPQMQNAGGEANYTIPPNTPVAGTDKFAVEQGVKSALTQPGRSAGSTSAKETPYMFSQDFKNNAASMASKFYEDFAARGDAKYNLTQDGSKVSWVRAITSKIGGDLTDPILTDAENSHKQLNVKLVDEAMNNVPKPNEEGMSVAELNIARENYNKALESAQAQAEKASKAYRDSLLQRYYKGNALTKAREVLAANDKRALALKSGPMGAILRAQQGMKEWRFGFDVGITLQQGLKALRMGSTSAAFGTINRIAGLISRSLGGSDDPFGLYDPTIPHDWQRASAGLSEFGQRAVGLPEAGNKSLPTTVAGKTLGRVQGGLEHMTNWQYNQLDRLGRVMYEGRLLQTKLMYNTPVIGHLWSGDIRDPQVQQDIARWVNTARSTAQTATLAGRAALESGLELSPQLTRAQFAELAQPFKTFNSRAEAMNTINQIVSTAGTFAMAYEVAKQIGLNPGSFGQFMNDVANPMSYNFGKITTKFTDGTGKHIVMPFLSQFSLENAVIRSLQETQKLAKGDVNAQQALAYIGDTAARYGFGRLNMIPSTAAQTAGFGYDNTGKWNNPVMGNRLPLGQAAIQSAPLPLNPFQQLEQNNFQPSNLVTNWPTTITNFLGGNPYPESDYSTIDRVSQDMFGSKFSDLTPVQMAKITKQAGNSGQIGDPKVRISAYAKADDFALKQFLDQNSVGSPRYSAASTYANAVGAKGFDIAHYDKIYAAQQAFQGQLLKNNPKLTLSQVQSFWNKYLSITGIDAMTKSYQTQAIVNDPGIVQALNDLQKAGQRQYGAPTWANNYLKAQNLGQ